MSSPLMPGSRLGGWTVERVLSWGRRGGLYRVVTETGPRLLKEVALPSLPAAQQLRRLQQCQEAIEVWRALRLPQVMAIEEVRMGEDRFYLLLPELPGEPASTQAPRRSSLAEATQLLRWAEQLCELVLALQRHQHPLALAVLEPDHLIAEATGGLIVFNPGWSELAWRGAEELRQVPVQEGLRKFAELMVFLASGSTPKEALPEQLSPALMWIVGRCLSEDRTRHYAGFQELRQALLTLPIQSQPSNRSKRDPLEDFDLSDLPPPPLARPLPGWVRWLSGMAVTLALVSLCLAFRQARPEPSNPSPGLALARGDRLVMLSLEGHKQSEIRLAGGIRCLAASVGGEQIYLGLRGESGLTVVDRFSQRIQHLPGQEAPTQLQVSGDGLELVGLLEHEKIIRWKLGSDKPRWLGQIPLETGGTEATLTAVRQGSQRSDGGILLLQPHQGLLLVDPDRGSNWASWNHPGANSALALEGLVVTAVSRERTLYALQGDLQPISQQTLPGGSGQTQLHKDSYRRQFWSVHDGGRVTLWAVPSLTQVGDFQLPSAPGWTCSDPYGCLWVVAQDGSLLKLESSPLGWQRLGRVDTAEATALVYLPLPAPPRREASQF